LEGTAKHFAAESKIKSKNVLFILYYCILRMNDSALCETFASLAVKYFTAKLAKKIRKGITSEMQGKSRQHDTLLTIISCLFVFRVKYATNVQR
jgi:hypothetical protein